MILKKIKLSSLSSASTLFKFISRYYGIVNSTINKQILKIIKMEKFTPPFVEN
jgi:hypothetical protein